MLRQYWRMWCYIGLAVVLFSWSYMQFGIRVTGHLLVFASLYMGAFDAYADVQRRRKMQSDQDI